MTDPTAPKSEPTVEERTLFAFDNASEFVDWLRDVSTPVAAAALDAAHNLRVRAAVRAAVEAERERCAKLVHTRGRFLPVEGDTLQQSIEFERVCIAAAIRAGGGEPTSTTAATDHTNAAPDDLRK